MTRLSMVFLIAGSLLPASAAAREAGPDSLPDWKRFVYQDLLPIMSRADEGEFLALADPAAMEEWERRFWLLRDPTPSTERNERREEHFKRLETARALYPADNEEGLDQRGQDYVLFGPPDESVELEEYFDDAGHHPARVTWIWLEPEMRATYSDWNLDGEWEQAFDEYPSTRRDVNRRLEQAFVQDGSADDADVLEDLRLRDPTKYQDLLRQLAQGEIINPLDVQSQALISELMGPKFRRMEAAYRSNRRDRKDTFVFDYGAPPLENVYFAVDCFRGVDGRSRVELSHQVRLRDLTFTRDFEAKEFKAELLRRVVFFDEKLRRASSSETRIPIRAEGLEDTHSSVLVPGLDIHLLAPGTYRMVFRLEDTTSGRLQIFTNPRVEVPAFEPDSLSLSDISFASLIERGSEPALYRKGDWVVYPHPLRSYASDRELRFYFEIYGLELDAQGLNDYTVTYRIRRQNPTVTRGWLWTREESSDAELGSTFVDRHSGEMARHPLAISAAEFAEDSYILEVEVLDRLSGRRARSRGQFSVLPPSALH